MCLGKKYLVETKWLQTICVNNVFMCERKVSNFFLIRILSECLPDYYLSFIVLVENDEKFVEENRVISAVRKFDILETFGV